MIKVYTVKYLLIKKRDKQGIKKKVNLIYFQVFFANMYFTCQILVFPLQKSSTFVVDTDLP